MATSDDELVNGAVRCEQQPARPGPGGLHPCMDCGTTSDEHGPRCRVEILRKLAVAVAHATELQKLRTELGTLRHQVAELLGRLEELEGPGQALIPELRANGVTRYKHGDLEIELSPGAAARLAYNDVERKSIGCIKSPGCPCYICERERDPDVRLHEPTVSVHKGPYPELDPPEPGPVGTFHEEKKQADPVPDDEQPLVQVDHEELARLRADQLSRRTGDGA